MVKGIGLFSKMSLLSAEHLDSGDHRKRIILSLIHHHLHSQIQVREELVFLRVSDLVNNIMIVIIIITFSKGYCII